MRNVFFTVVSYLAILLACNTTVSAEPVLRIGITAISPPYVYSLQKAEGLDPDLISVIIRRMGRAPVFAPSPHNRRSAVLREEHVDGITLWTKPEGVDCYASEPYRYWRNALFVRKQATDASLSQALAAGRVAIFRGSDHLKPELLALGLDPQKMVKVLGVDSAARMMLHNRIDAFIGDYPTMMYHLQSGTAEADKQVVVQRFLKPFPQRICFLNEADTISFNMALKSLIADETDILRRTAERHGMSERITPPLD